MTASGRFDQGRSRGWPSLLHPGGTPPVARCRRHPRPPLAAAVAVVAALVLAGSTAAPPAGAQQETEPAFPEPVVPPAAAPGLFGPPAPGTEPAALPTAIPDLAPSLRSSVLLPGGRAGGLPGSLRERRGLRLGKFAVAPRGSLALAYDDNINASETNREGDLVATLSGAVAVRSRFARHGLGFLASAATARYLENTDEATIDWYVSADGRLDLTQRSSLRADVGYTRGEENPESAEPGEDPVVHAINGGAAYSLRGNRISFQLGGNVGRLEVSDGTEAEERERSTYTAFASVSRELSDRLTVFAGPSYTLTDYEIDIVDGEPNRDSQAVRANVGARFILGPTVATSGTIGYSRLFFDDSGRSNNEALIGRGNLSWRINPAVLARVTISRSLDVTNVDDASSRTTTALSADVTWGLDPISTVSTGLSYAHSDFDGIARADDDIAVALSYSRALTGNVALNAGYRFSKRFSDEEGEEFYRNIVSVGLSAGF